MLDAEYRKKANDGEALMVARDASEPREALAALLQFALPADRWVFKREGRVREDGYDRTLISFKASDGDEIPAYLLEPHESGPLPAVLVHHQHAGQRNLGKSEVCGLIGDPLQAFGPALARRGVVVLAPDSIAFEDRRSRRSGMELDAEYDSLQHYNELAYRIVQGGTLMQKVLADSAVGISVLASLPGVDVGRIGMLGHSYGGNTTLFHAALDERIRFACSSGAACTYEAKIKRGTGIEMAEVIPGIARRFDIHDLVRLAAPRALLLVSAVDDPYSEDANAIYETALASFAAAGVAENLQHLRVEGPHALDQHRFDRIIDWTLKRCLA
jgi:dienelactone hydrolase